VNVACEVPESLEFAMLDAIVTERIRQALLDARDPSGHWVGELSASALSTATALFTLHLHDPVLHAQRIRRGLAWLRETQNPDGGFGDTIKSFSNISTTALCWAAFSIGENPDVTVKLEGWLTREAGSLDAEALAQTIKAKYGKDHTFSVPILTMLAVAGRLGAKPWKRIPQLPFELAACPFSWFEWLRLPVVSYALPALIAIGRVRHEKHPTWVLPHRWLRNLLAARTMRKLRAIQPTTGGYLEATPLTSFVVMSLLHAGLRDSEVVAEGVRFLVDSQRADGSWPIDTNLATWVTTLAVNALPVDALSASEKATIRDWLLGQQYQTHHPYTHAAPGGWAWTDLPGGVPDADDTPGALLALHKLGDHERVLNAAKLGCEWLLGLQNADGGIPTFCRGWTGLPFDRSSNDLTAHTLRAWSSWKPKLSTELQSGFERGLKFLIKNQRPDGAWAPLWFGNQHSSEIENLTYGTSRVLKCATLPECQTPDFQAAMARGFAWIEANQNPDGGWGGRLGTPSSLEETALACEVWPNDRGFAWLAEHTHGGQKFDPTPIGFYFANLWYYEKLYPLLFLNAALPK
jgi:squalene-hopene/tetraprenyl-beta-curcumene cyclase